MEGEWIVPLENSEFLVCGCALDSHAGVRCDNCCGIVHGCGIVQRLHGADGTSRGEGVEGSSLLGSLLHSCFVPEYD
jgi:hypothetical protein